MKKLFSIVALVCTSSLLAVEPPQTVFLPEGMTLEDVRKADKEIAISGFNVLVKRTHSKAVLYPLVFAKHPIRASTLMARYLFRSASLLQALNAKNVLPKFTTADGYLQYYKSLGENDLTVIAQDVALSLAPINFMINAVTQLQKTTIVRLACNWSPRMYNLISNRVLQHNKSGFLKTIEIGQLVNYDSFGPDKTTDEMDPQFVSDFGIHDIRYFQEYMKKYNPNCNKVIIFIADNIEMILLAVQAGMVGILHDTSEFPDYMCSAFPATLSVYHDLQKLGFDMNA